MAGYFSNLNAAQFMSLTTYRKSGEPKPTPVWFVDIGDKLFVYTQADSAKVKRIRNNGSVTVAPCKANGELTGSAVAAKARVVSDLAEDRAGLAAVAGKYGWQFRMFQIVGALRRTKTVRLAVEPG